jgi:hypothetical protein
VSEACQRRTVVELHGKSLRADSEETLDEAVTMSDDIGEVVFRAALDVGGEGLFSGPDPIADKIIGSGDPPLRVVCKIPAGFGLDSSWLFARSTEQRRAGGVRGPARRRQVRSSFELIRSDRLSLSPHL